MKRIVYALIAINLILLMGIMWVDTSPVDPVLPVVSGVEKLVLVSKLAAEKKAGVVKQVKAGSRVKHRKTKAIRAKTAQCYLMNYFISKQKAEAVISKIQALNYKARLDPIYPGKGRLLVYLPSYPNIKQAREVTRALKEKGIRDFQILAIRGNKNAISLGVFSHSDTAKERLKEIRDLGYQPVVQSVVGPEIKYRIFFHKPGRALLNADERRFFVNSFKKVKITTTKCQS